MSDEDARLTDFLEGDADSRAEDEDGGTDADGEADAADAGESEAVDAGASEAVDAGESEAIDVETAGDVSDPGGAGAVETEEVDAAEAGEAGDGSDAGAVEPIVATTRWAPDGAACDVCGAAVQRRWRDGDDLVCADCKAW